MAPTTPHPLRSLTTAVLLLLLPLLAEPAHVHADPTHARADCPACWFAALQTDVPEPAQPEPATPPTCGLLRAVALEVPVQTPRPSSASPRGPPIPRS